MENKELKLGADVLLEIIACVQKGLIELEDVSDLLRGIRVVQNGDELNLSTSYISTREK